MFRYGKIWIWLFLFGLHGCLKVSSCEVTVIYLITFVFIFSFVWIWILLLKVIQVHEIMTGNSKKHFCKSCFRYHPYITYVKAFSDIFSKDCLLSSGSLCAQNPASSGSAWILNRQLTQKHKDISAMLIHRGQIAAWPHLTTMSLRKLRS